MARETITPTVNGIGSLGAADRKWKNTYAVDAHADTVAAGTITADSIEADSMTVDSITVANLLKPDGSDWSAGGGQQTPPVQTFTATINATTEPGATVTATLNGTNKTAVADSSGQATITVDEAGTYSVSAAAADATSSTQSVVIANDGETKAVTLTFTRTGTLTVNSENGAVVTMTKGSYIVSKTVGASGNVSFNILSMGSVTVKAELNNVTSNTEIVNFTTNNQSETVTCSFIRLTVKGIVNEQYTVVKGTVNFNGSLDSTKQTVLYLPELGDYACTGTGTKDGETKTKNKTVSITEYADYTVNLWSTVYGVYIDTTDAVESTCVHKVTKMDNENLAPIAMNFSTGVCDMGGWADSFIMPKPCMLKYDGTVDYYLNPNDYTKKADGTASDVANTSYGGNAMMQFPRIFTKVVNDTANNRLYFYASDDKEDADYECYSCLKSDGSYADYFYMPIYEGAVVSGKMRSLSGLSTASSASLSLDQQMTYARANGNGWEINTWADEELLRVLGVIVLMRLNSQLAIGYGQTASNYAYTTGVGNTKGMFWGGSSSSAHANGTKWFGMENQWGSRYRRIAGVVTDSSNNVLIKNTVSTQDGSTGTGYNSAGTGYKNYGQIAGSSGTSGYIKTLNGQKGAMTIPKVMSGGSATTYYCDYGHVYPGYALGVGVNASDDAGLFCSVLNDTASVANAYLGASSSYHEL